MYSVQKHIASKPSIEELNYQRAALEKETLNTLIRDQAISMHYKINAFLEGVIYNADASLEKIGQAIRPIISSNSSKVNWAKLLNWLQKDKDNEKVTELNKLNEQIKEILKKPQIQKIQEIIDYCAVGNASLFQLEVNDNRIFYGLRKISNQFAKFVKSSLKKELKTYKTISNHIKRMCI